MALVLSAGLADFGDVRRVSAFDKGRSARVVAADGAERKARAGEEDPVLQLQVPPSPRRRGPHGLVYLRLQRRAGLEDGPEAPLVQLVIPAGGKAQARDHRLQTRRPRPCLLWRLVRNGSGGVVVDGGQELWTGL